MAINLPDLVSWVHIFLISFIELNTRNKEGIFVFSHKYANICHGELYQSNILKLLIEVQFVF